MIADLEIATAKYPLIRLITVPMRGTQEPQKDFHGQWQTCRPDTVGGFTAVGYFFGRTLNQMLEVPIGLINDSWGGSACEAWIRRDILAADEKYAPMLKRWEKLEKDFAEWQTAAAKAKAEGKKPPAPSPENLADLMGGNSRPGNIYNGVLKPTIGYGIRGVYLVSGRIKRGEGLSVSRLVSADDQELAR